MERCRGQISIKGIIVPADWDEKGNIIRVAIMTRGEGEYLVEGNTTGKKLLGMMRREVEVRGLVREKGGEKIITVEDCKKTKRGSL
jgi:5S rRNA maturation endonuclease (ribonuclease M5)